MASGLDKFLHQQPTNHQQFAVWVKAFLNFDVHSHVTCKPRNPTEAAQWDKEGRVAHNCQLDYAAGAFLNEYSSCVLIAARNAGKSYAAAITCIADCHFKPGIKVAVAAFIRNQSDYIYEYCVDFLGIFASKIGRKLWTVTKDQITFNNGSSIKFFSGGKSSAGVKGYHPNILIVDEGDLFSQEQFDGIANSLEAAGKFQRRFDVLSTNYTVHGDGVILKQIEKYTEFNKTLNPALLPCKVFRICLLDILQKCDDRFECDKCQLWKYCKGKAKECGGHYKIEAALETMRDSSLPTFESQMLLLRPSSEHSYFPNFSIITHACDPEIPYDPRKLTLVGMDFGAGRCPHACLIIQKDPPYLDPSGKPIKGDPGAYWVIDEFLEPLSLERMCDRMKAKYPNILDTDMYYDPAGNRVEHMLGAKSYADVLKAQGFHPRCRPVMRLNSFQQLHRLIQPAMGEPRLKVNKRCVNLIRQIQAAEHKVIRNQIVEEPEDGKGDDLLDCLRYVVSNTWGTYSKYNGSRKLLWLGTSAFR